MTNVCSGVCVCVCVWPPNCLANDGSTSFDRAFSKKVKQQPRLIRSLEQEINLDLSSLSIRVQASYIERSIDREFLPVVMLQREEIVHEPAILFARSDCLPQALKA